MTVSDSETKANYRHSTLARGTVSGFVAWLRERDDLRSADKDMIASLAAEYERTRGRIR